MPPKPHSFTRSLAIVGRAWAIGLSILYANMTLNAAMIKSKPQKKDEANDAHH